MRLMAAVSSMTNFQTKVLIGVVAGALLFGILLGSGVLRVGVGGPPHGAPSHGPEAPLSDPSNTVNDGRDPGRPILPPSDLGFVDTRGGWEWGNRCFRNILANNWGWAKAECDEALKLRPLSPQPRASLLYNEGLIAAEAGQIDAARSYFTESLALREDAAVRNALESLPDAASTDSK